MDRCLKVTAALNRVTRVVGRAVVVQSAEFDKWFCVIIAYNADALTRISPVKAINQRRPKRCRVTHGESFAEIGERVQGYIAKQIWRIGIEIVAQRPTPE